MTARPADRDRTAVYAAELAAFDGTDLEEVEDFGEIATAARLVVADPWWPGPEVEVRRSRSDAGSSSARCDLATSGSLVVIRLASVQMTMATAAHELAHALAGVQHGHDGLFRRAFLDVVAVITNLDSTDRRHGLHVGQLSEAFAGAGLSVAERSWSAPPHHGDAIAL